MTVKVRLPLFVFWRVSFTGPEILWRLHWSSPLQACNSDNLYAELWLQKRAEIGHPLGVAAPQPAVDPGKLSGPPSLEPAELLVEIGCEELPPADIQAARQQLRSVDCQLNKPSHVFQELSPET